MQMQLPLFPSNTKLINSTLGVILIDSTVYYLHNGSPIFCHEESDLNHYRYILGNLVEMKLCSCGELSSALGVPIRTVQRYAKAFREKGSDWFFHREEKRGGVQKLDEEAMQKVQELLDGHIAVAKIARQMGVTEGAIRYHLRKGRLKKSKDDKSITAVPSDLPGERNKEFVEVADLFGIAANWIEERSAAGRGELSATPIQFQPSRTLAYGGVLLLLPSLIECGLLSYKKHYCELDKGYYYIDFIILLIAFMYLCRIKNPEQLGRVNPGEFGRLLGIDRVPESKCLRKKIKQICAQEKSKEWNRDLARQWISGEDNEFYYIDGHVQIYHGDKAQLGKKYIARQKLCLPGVQEFWVNNMEGLPYFYVRGEVNEKLLEMLETKIIPELLLQMPQKYSEEELEADPDLARFTLVFDREAYSPAFFHRIWETHRIAVLTYRKNVKDKWEESCFQSYPITVEGSDSMMKLAEKTVEIKEIPFREIRKLSTDGHQTSVMTTNKKLGITLVALYMFARWSQENYFRYMRQDYDFDKMLQYAVEQIDGETQVNHPRYSKLTYQKGKIREKISRREAKLYNLIEENVDGALEENKKNEIKQQKLRMEIEELREEEQVILTERKKYPSKIKVKDMPDQIRYNQLGGESKHFQNILKMICYRAESAFANLLAPHYKKSIDEKRSLVKKIINTSIDLRPDYKTNKLHVTLYTLPAPRDNEALDKIIETLNDSSTKYPGTDLVLYYETATSQIT